MANIAPEVDVVLHEMLRKLAALARKAYPPLTRERLRFLFPLCPQNSICTPYYPAGLTRAASEKAPPTTNRLPQGQSVTPGAIGYPRGNRFVRLAGNQDRLSVRVGKPGAVAQLELYGPKSKGKTLADYANDEVISNEWVLESGSEDLVEVAPSADGTSAQVKGLAPGTAYVVARMQGLGSVIIPVDVT